ncbi:MAG: PIN domain-containing protein [Syntrophobacteraceae bacterium]
MVALYIVDTNSFYTLGHYYPSRFPTIWRKVDDLVREGKLRSVKEVRREIESNCPFDHITEWVRTNRKIFKAPSIEEMTVVSDILSKKQYRRLVKRSNILRGLPVADPFIIAAAKVYHGCVVTQEIYKPDGARIPNACDELRIQCINVEQFLEYEGLVY